MYLILMRISLLVLSASETVVSGWYLNIWLLVSMCHFQPSWKLDDDYVGYLGFHHRICSSEIDRETLEMSNFQWKGRMLCRAGSSFFQNLQTANGAILQGSLMFCLPMWDFPVFQSPGGPHFCSQRQWWSDDGAPDGSMIGSLSAIGSSGMSLSSPQSELVQNFAWKWPPELSRNIAWHAVGFESQISPHFPTGKSVSPCHQDELNALTMAFRCQSCGRISSDPWRWCWEKNTS